MWSEDVFCGKRKEKSIITSAQNVAKNRRTGTVSTITSEIKDATLVRDNSNREQK